MTKGVRHYVLIKIRGIPDLVEVLRDLASPIPALGMGFAVRLSQDISSFRHLSDQFEGRIGKPDPPWAAIRLAGTISYASKVALLPIDIEVPPFRGKSLSRPRTCSEQERDGAQVFEIWVFYTKQLWLGRGLEETFCLFKRQRPLPDIIFGSLFRSLPAHETDHCIERNDHLPLYCLRLSRGTNFLTSFKKINVSDLIHRCIGAEVFAELLDKPALSGIRNEMIRNLPQTKRAIFGTSVQHGFLLSSINCLVAAQ